MLSFCEVFQQSWRWHFLPAPVSLGAQGQCSPAAASLPCQGWVNSRVPTSLSIPPGTGRALRGVAGLIPVLLSQGTNKILRS